MWVIDVERIAPWLRSLDTDSRHQVIAALEILQEHGPALGRPLVDSISGSQFRNMKELRPGSSGRSEMRILFIFAPLRQAIMLVAGDKSGQWKKWYRDSIPVAEQLYAEHLRTIVRTEK